MEACIKSGMRVFPWIMEFYSEIDALDDQRPHPFSDYMNSYGQGYIEQLPMRYWTHFGGRAVQTYKNVLPLKPLEMILDSPACRELQNTTHFHIDLFGNYVPGLCTGLAIDMEDLVKKLDESKYPFLNVLYHDGISGFLKYAHKEYHFKPQPEYLNKCDLCNDIRSFLVNECQINSHELEPKGYYA